MKIKFCRVLIVFLLGLSLPGQAQDLTGIWRGYFVTEMGEQYRLEFQVEQSKAKSVKGVSYSYLDTRFYGKASMMGNFVIKNGSFTIQEVRTTEVRNMSGGSTCLMNYKFTYAKSGKEEFLEGTYVGKTEDRQNPKNNGKWGDCGGGTVYLRRVTTSDFILEPFLRKTAPVTTTPAAPLTPKKNTTAATKKPSAPVKKNKTAPAKTTPPVVKKSPAKKPDVPLRDSVGMNKTIARAPIEKVTERRTAFIPEVTRSRKNDLVETIAVSSHEVVIRLYDNGEIDNDTVSLYVNGQMVLANKRLSTVPIIYTLQLDENSPDQTIVLVAENMGRIPPNTSLMVVQDGENRHQVGITSTEQKNAMVRFRFKKSSE
jgi:hypothetical protein